MEDGDADLAFLSFVFFLIDLGRLVGVWWSETD